MLDALLMTCFAVCAPQGPASPLAEAVAVRGETELTPAAAFSSARRKAEEHLLERWQQRAERASAAQRPFWIPEVLVEPAIRRWLGDLPVERMLLLVDRQDQERAHEFGNSYQTTLWVAEEPRAVEQGERQWKSRLRALERTTAIKYGAITASWVVLGVLLGWLDRLSRGYMTGRLRLLGVLAAAAVPTITFLV